MPFREQSFTRTTGGWRVLIIDESPATFERIRSLLPDGSQATHAANLEVARRVLEDSVIDCIILGDVHDLRDVAGRGTPIVVVTDLTSHELAVDAMKLGVTDYLRKTALDGPTLARAVGVAIARREFALCDAELRALAKALPAVIWSVDHAGRLLALYGRRLIEMGLAGASIEGRTLADMFSTALAADGVAALANAVEAALLGRASRVGVAVDGRSYDGHVVPVIGDSGRPTGATGILIEVSNREQPEA